MINITITTPLTPEERKLLAALLNGVDKKDTKSHVFASKEHKPNDPDCECNECRYVRSELPKATAYVKAKAKPKPEPSINGAEHLMVAKSLRKSERDVLLTIQAYDDWIDASQLRVLLDKSYPAIATVITRLKKKQLLQYYFPSGDGYRGPVATKYKLNEVALEVMKWVDKKE